MRAEVLPAPRKQGDGQKRGTEKEVRSSCYDSRSVSAYHSGQSGNTVFAVRSRIDSIACLVLAIDRSSFLPRQAGDSLLRQRGRGDMELQFNSYVQRRADDQFDRLFREIKFKFDVIRQHE